MQTLSIGLATRMRPGDVVRTVNRTLENITLPDTKLVIIGDNDDYGTLSVQEKITDPRVVWSFEPREDSLGGKYNRLMKIAPADVYLVMVDYAPHVTKGFDSIIMDAARVYPDGYAVVVNHLANLSFPQINAVTHKLAVRLGGIYPEIFPYWFVDHWLGDIADLIGRNVFADVFVDCSQRPGTMDKREPEFWGNVFGWTTLDRRKIAHEIINSPDFDETPARKAALLRNHPIVEESSMMINMGLRGMPGIDINDERYLRIRQKAIELVQERMKEAEQLQKAKQAA